jgi:drug/metabolite transporter (DMT)-like permease
MSHVWRGLVGTTAMGLMFTGLGLLPLPEVTAIGYAAPILVVIFAAMFLGEKVRAFRLSMVALASRGCSWCSRPGCRSTPPRPTPPDAGCRRRAALAVFAALAQVFVRKMVQTESTAAIVFYFSLTATVMSFLTLPWGWAWPPLWVLALLVLAGLLGGIGQILLTSSYRMPTPR